jgi:hypothetical protein
VAEFVIGIVVNVLGHVAIQDLKSDPAESATPAIPIPLRNERGFTVWLGWLLMSSPAASGAIWVARRSSLAILHTPIQ